MNALMNLLTIADSGFPSGAYGHSAGLEYAIQAGWVRQRADLEAWAANALRRSFVPLDLRAAAKAFFCDGSELATLNGEVSAFRTSAVQRDASAQVGRSFHQSARNAYTWTEFPGTAWIEASTDLSVPQFPIAWALVCRGLGLDVDAMADGLVISSLRQMSVVAMRIVPMGQRDAFGAQAALIHDLEICRDWDLEIQKPLESFVPAQEIAGIGHETLQRRYFRS